jgi:hypothetical protein
MARGGAAVGLYRALWRITSGMKKKDSALQVCRKLAWAQPWLRIGRGCLGSGQCAQSDTAGPRQHSGGLQPSLPILTQHACPADPSALPGHLGVAQLHRSRAGVHGDGRGAAARPRHEADHVSVHGDARRDAAATSHQARRTRGRRPALPSPAASEPSPPLARPGSARTVPWFCSHTGLGIELGPPRGPRAAAVAAGGGPCDNRRPRPSTPPAGITSKPAKPLGRRTQARCCSRWAPAMLFSFSQHTKRVSGQ